MTPIKTPFGGTLEFYPLPDTSGKGTVLICPGGGYSFLAEREGRPIADAFNQNGYSAAILNYCLDRDVHGTNPVKELAWAVRYLRTASEWNGLVHKLWVSGFSAGGHLAASLGTLWNESLYRRRTGPQQARWPDPWLPGHLHGGLRPRAFPQTSHGR